MPWCDTPEKGTCAVWHYSTFSKCGGVDDDGGMESAICLQSLFLLPLPSLN